MTAWFGTSDVLADYAADRFVAEEASAQRMAIDCLLAPQHERVVIVLEPDNRGCIG